MSLETTVLVCHRFSIKNKLGGLHLSTFVPVLHGFQCDLKINVVIYYVGQSGTLDSGERSLPFGYLFFRSFQHFIFIFKPYTDNFEREIYMHEDLISIPRLMFFIKKKIGKKLY